MIDKPFCFFAYQSSAASVSDETLSVKRGMSGTMALQIETRHDLSPGDIDAIEDRLYEYNSHAIGRNDGQGVGFIICDEAGHMIGVAAGYTWAATSELKQLWVDKAYRGRGYARKLLNAFVTEAYSRGVRQIWVASYDFQAPGMYGGLDRAVQRVDRKSPRSSAAA
jgi:GNAT superfamily N-acetyltransferase